MSGYVLGGQVYPPGKSNDFSGGANVFKITFSMGIDTDDAAIAEAKRVIQKERQQAKDGMFVGATLYWGDRMIKNFPSGEK